MCGRDTGKVGTFRVGLAQIAQSILTKGDHLFLGIFWCPSLQVQITQKTTLRPQNWRSTMPQNPTKNIDNETARFQPTITRKTTHLPRVMHHRHRLKHSPHGLDKIPSNFKTRQRHLILYLPRRHSKPLIFLYFIYHTYISHDTARDAFRIVNFSLNSVTLCKAINEVFIVLLHC